ncbi:MAG: rhodanese-like domain-containing protein [bacterium]|nr:rhodanese-like domain-containing protein [bacterium]
MKANLKLTIAGALAITALSAYVYAGDAACGSSGAPATDQAVCGAAAKTPCSAAGQAACGDKCAAGAGKCDMAGAGKCDKAGAGKCDKAGAGKCDMAGAGKCDKAGAGKCDKAGAGKCDKAGAGKCDKGAKVTHVTTDQLAGLLGTVVVVDARTAKYDDGKRIPGAITVPADATAEQITAALPDKSAKVVVYCTSPKCPASAKLAKTLVKYGYTAVQKYPDGIEGWVAAGKPTTQATPAGK